MLNNKEVFKIIKEIEQDMEIKATIIAREQNLDKDDTRSIVYLTTFNFFKKYYNSKKSKPITFFINYCVPRSRIEIIRQTHPVKLSYNSIEKGLNKNFSFISLDCKTGEADDNDLYDLYATYEDNSIDFYDSKSFSDKILNKSNLTAREKKVLKMHYGLYGDKEYSLKEIGKTYNVSLEMARKIRDNGIRKIRQYNKIGEY